MSIQQLFSKCGLKTSSISNIWKLTRSANSETSTPGLLNQKFLGGRAQQLYSTNSPGDSVQHQSLKTSVIQNKATLTLKKFPHVVPGVTY